MQRPSLAAIHVAGAYMFVAALWILLSDWLISLLPPAIETSLQTVKGLLFVGVTGLVLFLLVQRMGEDVVRESKQTRSVELLLEQVIRTVPVGVLFVNSDREITFMNPGAELLLGVVSRHAVGRQLEELCCHGSGEATARIGELLRTGSVDDMRLGDPSDPSPRALIARAAAVDPSTSAAGWVIALADVTESHRAGERIQRLMRSYRFLAQSLMLCGRGGERDALLSQIGTLAMEKAGYLGVWSILKSGPGADFEPVALRGVDDEVRETAELLRSQALQPHSAPAEVLLSPEITVANDVERDPSSLWYGSSAGIGSAASFGVAGPCSVQASITFFSAVPGYFDAEEVEVLRQLQGALAFAFEKIGLDEQRMAAEEGVMRSEQEYRQLFMCNPTPMWVYDVSTLRFLAVNDAAIRKYGYTHDQFVRMSITEIRPADEVPALLEHVRQPRSGFQDAGIWTHRDSHGRTFPVQVSTHRLDWDSHHAELVMAQEIARML